MKLKELLDAHDKHRPQESLAANLGDGYLMSHNRVYRGIRHASLKCGYRYRSQRFFDYDALALTQLPKILEFKTIPYGNNVRPLREIEVKLPGHFRWSELPPLRPNSVFHESAHGVAHELRKKIFGKEKKPKGKEIPSYVLGLLIEEAFANACESLANAEAKDAIHDEFLYKNSYVMEKEGVRKILRASIKRWGSTLTFQLLFFSFLHANFLQTRIEQMDLERVLSLVFAQDPTSFAETKDRAQALKVLQIGFDLDPAFTQFTNAFCIRLAGVEGELHEVLSFDFLGFFEQTAYRKLLASLARVVRS